MATSFGILAGVLETALLLSDVSTATKGNLTLGAYLWWMPLTANLALFAVLAVLGWGCTRARPGPVTTAGLTFVFAFIACLAPLRVVAGYLGILAPILLAGGLALQLARRVSSRLYPAPKWLRRFAAVGVLLPLVIAAGIETSRARAERRALESLVTPPRGAPNILLLVLDTVRAMNLSVYGYHLRTSPALEALAARGTLFDRVLATASWTRPAHASLFTGRWEHELAAGYFTPLDDNHPTLAGELTRSGYRSGGFTANLVHTTRSTGLARGFLHYEDHPLTLTQVLVSAANPRTVYHALEGPLGLPSTKWDYHRKTSADINRAILSWLESSGAAPFFVFANYMDAHAEYSPRPPFDTAFAEAVYPPVRPPRAGGMGRVLPMRPYDQAIATIDHDIAALLEALEQRGLLENTIVVVTSDHGEAFGEHGLYGHANALYLPMLQVPLILSWPGKIPAGHRVEEWVSTRELPATLLHLANPNGGQPIPGPLLSDRWEGRGPTDRALFAGADYTPNNPAWFPTSKGDIQGILLEDHMLLREADNHRELFDLSRDPWMTTDLLAAPGSPDLAASLERRLEQAAGPPTPVASQGRRAEAGRK